MAKIKRSEKPKCLNRYIWNEKIKRWYRDKILQKWDNPRFSNTQCYKEVKEELMKMCNNTCPFCFQTYPPELFFEIENFRPKKGNFARPDLTFEWKNLFPIYRYINGLKSDNWDEKLLKPDEDNYLDYFIYFPENGEIQPKIALDTEQKERAKITINLYGLNEKKLCQMRKTNYKIFLKNPNSPISFKPLF